MMRMTTFAIAALASSCCQTVWMEVTRRESAPPHAVVLPEVRGGTIPIPRLENRFLSGVTVDAAGYTDQLDPRNNASEEITAALAALERIWAIGDGSAKHDVLTDAKAGPYDGKLTCRKRRKETICVGVEVVGLTRLDFEPQVVRVTYKRDGVPAVEWHAVKSCEGLVTEGETDGPATPEVAASGHQRPCNSTQHGTRFTVTQPIDGTEGMPVQIELAAGFALSKPALTFVHLSDTQLRDTDVKLTNPVLSAQLDHLVESFEYDPDQEQYGPELTEALVATINQEVHERAAAPALAPSFVIHTGDAIDSSTKRELVLFHEIMDRLTIPWFNVIGNHDVLVFGNFLPAKDADDARCATQESVVAPYVKVPRWLIPGRLCVPEKITGHVGPHDAFIATGDHATARATFIGEHLRHGRAKLVPDRNRDMCEGVLKPGANDRAHGFDLSHKTERPGYYAFALDLYLDQHHRRGIFIVLNTEDLDTNEGGNSGRIGKTQLEWLTKALMTCVHDRDLVFLFGHHALGEIKLPGKRVLRDHDLMQRANIVAYFYGHDHKHGLCRARGACTKFWELESGSLIEHPQEGRLVRIKSIGAGIGFIETVVFTERLADETSSFAKRVAFARAGADRDHCLRNRCSGDNRVRRKDGAFTNARLFFKLP